MCALALPVAWLRTHNEKEGSVFARLATLDFGCQVSEVSNMAIKKARRLLLAKRRDIPSPVESCDGRSGFPLVSYGVRRCCGKTPRGHFPE
jgi:hypothetical protein